jgi:hypothetical protein
VHGPDTGVKVEIEPQTELKIGTDLGAVIMDDVR